MLYQAVMIMLTLPSWVNGSSCLHPILEDLTTCTNDISMVWQLHGISKKIDSFLTMTANPNWPEIVQELLPGQTVADRPDLVSHVLYLKKKALLNAIVKDGIFGPCVAHVYA